MSEYSNSKFTDSQNTAWFKTYSLIPKGSLVLDVGCSSGNFGEALIIRKGCVVDGVELDKSDFLQAKKKLRNVYNINIETDDISVIRENYDVICLGDVVEHLVNPVVSLAKCKALLKPNGIIVFSVPNMAHVAIRLLLLSGNFDYAETGLLDKTHLHFYNLEEVKRVFGESGYILDKIDFVEKDYPDELVTNRLKKIGLTPDKEFLKSMHTPEAAAFQFVGVAKPGKTKVKKLDKFGPIDFFEEYFTNVKNDLNSRILDLEKQNEVLSIDAKKWRYLRHPVKLLSKLLTKRRHS